jgi:hypothetical protein
VRILVSGSSGLVGRALVSTLLRDGHSLGRLVRSASRTDSDIVWDPGSGCFDAGAAEGFDAVVHLAGESIAGRWTGARKAAIRRSRVEGTHLLAEGLATLAKPPRVILCASATGFYGSSDRLMDESCPAGAGFLADVCKEWEEAAEPARKKGLRVVHLRFGVVLSSDGGALKRMLPVFKLGLGGRLGSGEQWMSWVAIDDVVGVVRYALATDDLRGSINVVAPVPVKNAEFTRTLARVLHRPAPFPVPALVLRFAFGEMADETLLASSRVLPGVLTKRHYPFARPDLEGALRAVLAPAGKN